MSKPFETIPEIKHGMARIDEAIDHMRLVYDMAGEDVLAGMALAWVQGETMYPDTEEQIQGLEALAAMLVYGFVKERSKA